METRNVLDWQGNVIGTMSLPIGTAESVWSERLAKFATAPENQIPPITPRQLRLQLLSFGITNTQVETAINSALEGADREAALIEWDYSIEFDRYHPFVDAIGIVLGFTSEEIDQIWLEARGK